ncbi:MAG TPA: hypothetical protein VGN12_27640 [Pirellulales bacterium]
MLATLVVATTGRSALATLPRIDPSGQRLFLWDAPPLTRYVPEPAKPTHFNMMFLRVAPAKVIAPVGAEVVLVGSICGPDGYMHARERVEWMLAPGGVGQFVDLNQTSWLDRVKHPQDTPRKLDNSFAVGSTSTKYVALTRGTATLDDDVPVQKGQAWVTVTSPVEGASFVTAFAPNVFGWDQRQRTSTIYWVDAQWSFPVPATNPVGTRHAFTTTVTRQSDRTPLVGWIVRYEITGGPAAGFAPDERQVIEEPTNALGQATAEIAQQSPAPGTNTISVQIVRPAELSGSYGQRLVVGNSVTTSSWTTAGNLSLRTLGPSQATTGSTIGYRIEVGNPSPLSTRGVVVTNQIPAGLTFLSSNPPAQPGRGTLQWNLGDLGAGQSQAIEVDFRADQPGIVNNCAVLNTGEGTTAQSCATTTITAVAVPTQSLTVTMSAPQSAAVGQDVDFITLVTNHGVSATPVLTVVDRFDAGLQHANLASPIERNLEAIQPGQTQRVIITLRPMQPGQLCNTLEVHDTAGGILGNAQACVNAAVAAAPSVAKPTITVKKTGPASVAAGGIADFVIEITNTSQVPATQLQLADSYDRAMSPISATEGHDWSRDGAGDLVWLLDSLPAGKTVRYQVRCQCVTPAANACNRATVTTAEGATASDEACLAITQAAAPPAPPAGAARLTIAVADLVEPVALKANTTYEVKITNNGQGPDSQVVLTVTVPDKMTPMGVGPGGIATAAILGKTVRFDPVPTIAPGETLTYRIQARGDEAGQAQFRAQATSAGNPAGVVGEELTTIFAP